MSRNEFPGHQRERERETTRKEDMTYCLMGICLIKMPMLYGEGKNAFMGFQEEILKSTNDQKTLSDSILLFNCKLDVTPSYSQGGGGNTSSGLDICKSK